MMNRFTLAKLKYYLPRIVLGAIFLTSGLNGFFNFLPDPDYSAEGRSFIEAMKASGFWWVALKSLEVIGGTLLISKGAGRFGVLVLAPVTLGILMFHLFLSPQGSTLGIVVFVLEVFLIIAWRKRLIHFFHHPHRIHPTPHGPKAVY